MTRFKLKGIADVEKLLARIFTYSVKHKKKAVYFENVSLIKLKEFRLLLQTLSSATDLLEPLLAKKEQF